MTADPENSVMSSYLIVSRACRGGARRDRTDDLMLAKHALYQLSYGPFSGAQGRLEVISLDTYHR
jgi:hypothetical protein